MTVLLEEKTEFQSMVIRTDPQVPGAIILDLDNSWQFSSALEHRYHEAMVAIPMCAAEALDNVLICGGGDGLAMREVLRFKEVDHVDLVEIDRRVIEVFSKDNFLRGLNEYAFEDKRTHVTIGDARKFVDNPCRQYDLVFLDFPSPTTLNQPKNYDDLFSPSQIQKFVGLLKPQGILVMQTSVNETLMSRLLGLMLRLGYCAWNYDVFYDSTDGDHDNFSVFCPYRLERLRDVPEACRYVTNRHVEVGLSPVTEVTQSTMEYYSLFEYTEELD